eukprot:362041-Chlamydomonas_euryale.AAC.1
MSQAARAAGAPTKTSSKHRHRDKCGNGPPHDRPAGKEPGAGAPLWPSKRAPDNGNIPCGWDVALVCTA